MKVRFVRWHTLTLFAFLVANKITKEFRLFLYCFSVTLFTNVLVTRVVCLSLRRHGSRAHSCTDNFTIEESVLSDYKRSSFDYLILWVGIIFNFICQPDCATRCPDICINFILNVSVWIFVNEIYIWIGRLSKADCPS